MKYSKKNSIHNLQHSPTYSVLGTVSSRYCRTDLIIITKGTKKDDCKHFTTALKNQIKIMYLKLNVQNPQNET
jgi:hypothetical protein